MRIVLDTNIFISGLITSKSPPGKLVIAWLENRFTLITSEFQVNELKRVTTYPKLRTLIQTNQVNDLFNNISSSALIVSELPDIEVSQDSDDNKILATALKGKADLLVTGDKRDLISLHEYKDTLIITANQALNYIQ